MAQIFHGEQAVEKAAEVYGIPVEDIGFIAKHIIMEEGYREDLYEDTGTKKEITSGIGQTKENIGKNFFTEVLPVYVNRAKATTRGFEKLPEYAQAAVVSMAYRGDWGPNTKEFLAAGNWEAAADEYLNHKNYEEGTKKDATDEQKAVAARMKRNSEAIKRLAREERAATAGTFPEAMQ